MNNTSTFRYWKLYGYKLLVLELSREAKLRWNYLPWYGEYLLLSHLVFTFVHSSQRYVLYLHKYFYWLTLRYIFFYLLWLVTKYRNVVSPFLASAAGQVTTCDIGFLGPNCEVRKCCINTIDSASWCYFEINDKFYSIF